MNTAEPKITLKELFASTWRIYKGNILSIILISFLVFIPLNSITFLINYFWGKSSFELNSDNEINLNLYEKINRFVNKDTIIDSQVDDLEEIEYEEDENTLRCSICGIKVDPDKLICPMCRSVIRHNTQTGEDELS